MHVAVNANDCSLTITLNGSAGKQPLKIHPANRSPLHPANPANAFDEVGMHHNKALQFAYANSANFYAFEQQQQLISEYVSGIQFESKAMRAAQKRPVGKTPYDTIFWPPIPDWLLEQEFQSIIRASEDFDPSVHAYEAFKDALVAFEGRYTKHFGDSQDALAILGCCSMCRWSMALWTTHHIEIAESMAAAGTGNPQEVIMACNKVARADRKGYRESMKLVGDVAIAIGRAAERSHDAEKNIPQKVTVN